MKMSEQKLWIVVGALSLGACQIDRDPGRTSTTDPTMDRSGVGSSRTADPSRPNRDMTSPSVGTPSPNDPYNRQPGLNSAQRDAVPQTPGIPPRAPVGAPGVTPPGTGGASGAAPLGSPGIPSGGTSGVSPGGTTGTSSATPGGTSGGSTIGAPGGSPGGAGAAGAAAGGAGM